MAHAETSQIVTTNIVNEIILREKIALELDLSTPSCVNKG